MSSNSLTNGYHGDIQANGTILTGNNAAGGWVVKKFGGTSVGKFALNIVDVVRYGQASLRYHLRTIDKSNASILSGRACPTTK